jgi:2-methylcitrate dehydratase PrpD
MNAMLELVEEHDLKRRDVDEIYLYAGSNILNPLRYALPQTGLEGKFSIPFCLASILLRRRAGVREFSDDFVRSPDVQELMRQVKTILDPEIEARGYTKIMSRVEVRLRDGRVLQKDSGPYKGGPENPLTDAELEKKFVSCAELALPRENVYQGLELIRGIEKIENVRLLTAALVNE